MAALAVRDPDPVLSCCSPGVEGAHLVDTQKLLSAFLSGRNEKTIKAYSQDLADFQAFVGVASLSDAARLLLSQGHGPANALALSYRTHLVQRGLQPATINRRFAAMRSLVHLARTFGIVPWRLEVQNVRSEPFRDTRGPGRRGFRCLLEEVEHDHAKKASRNCLILRHTAITEACKAAQANGIGLEEVLDFSRHSRKSIAILIVYRDREHNVQGQLASLVAAGV